MDLGYMWVWNGGYKREVEKVYNEELQNLYRTLSRKWAHHVARMRVKKHACKRFGHKS